MKAIFENPMYKGIQKILAFLFFIVLITDLLGYIPDDFLRGRTVSAVALIILLPRAVEDSYYWWKKKLSKS